MIVPAAPLTHAAGPVLLDGGLSNALEQRGHDLTDALWTARLLRDAVQAAEMCPALALSVRNA